MIISAPRRTRSVTVPVTNKLTETMPAMRRAVSLVIFAIIAMFCDRLIQWTMERKERR